MQRLGFTFIELIVVIGIFLLLITLGSITFSSSYTSTNLSATVSQLLSDLKSQQIKATSGEMAGVTVPDGWGIKFFADRYVLFPGTTYDANSPLLVTVTTPTSLTITTTFSSDQVVFLRLSGEIANYSDSANSITLTQNLNTRNIILNKYGASLEN